MEPSVDVVIPTQGRASLGGALRSVREQTYSNINIIVVLDDPSQYDHVVSELLPGENLVRTDGFVGGGRARNLGVSAGRSTLVAFLDDDDWWDRRKLELQVQMHIEASTSLSFTGTWFHGSNGHVRRLPGRAMSTGESVADYLVARSKPRHGDGYLQTSSLLIDRQLLEQTCWDISLPKHQDWDLIIRAAKTSPFSLHPEPLVHVAQASSNSISRSRDANASELFYQKHRNSMSSTGRSDFIWTQMIRGALGCGDVSKAISILKRERPYQARPVAILVGIRGYLEWRQASRTQSGS